MVRIPTAEEQGRRQAPTSFRVEPQVSAPVEAFRDDTFGQIADAANAAASLTRSVGDVLAIREQEQAKRDTASLNTAIAEYQRWDLDYSSRIQENRGAAATPELLAQARTDRDAEISRLSDTMRTPEIGQALRNRLTPSYVSGQQALARYVDQESQRYGKAAANDASTAAITNSINTGRGQSAQEYAQSFNDIVVPQLQQQAALNGIPADGLIREQRAYAYNTIASTALAEGNPERARDLLNQWRDQMDPTQAAALSEAILAKENYDEGRALAQSLIDLPAAEQAAALRNVDNDAVRTSARSHLAIYKAEIRAENERVYEETTAQNFNRLDQFGFNLTAGQEFVDSLPEGTANERAIKSQTRAYFNAIKSEGGLQPRTDPAAYDAAVQEIAQGTITRPEQLVAKYGPKISRQDLQGDLVGLLEGSQGISAEDINTTYAFATGEDGLPNVELTPDQKADRGAFARWAQNKIRQENAAGREGYLQQLADQWTLEGRWTRSGYFENDDITLGEAIRRGEVDFWIHPRATVEWNYLTPEQRQTLIRRFGNADRALEHMSQTLLYIEGNGTGRNVGTGLPAESTAPAGTIPRPLMGGGFVPSTQAFVGPQNSPGRPNPRRPAASPILTPSNRATGGNG